MSSPREMLRQALEEMKLFNTAKEMADCFERWANKIKQTFPGWNSVRDRTSDGGYVFIGRTLGQVLVVTIDCKIYKGSDPELITRIKSVNPLIFEVNYNKLTRIF